jgi:hypothetical protein
MLIIEKESSDFMELDLLITEPICTGVINITDGVQY